ncbi:hypothetical protein Ddc_10316 [Ditylenchus destructor]|nr:hypothetical protein Ddc_10316 [Ditylenchus destructor]
MRIFNTLSMHKKKTSNRRTSKITIDNIELVDIFRFFNRKEISNVTLVNRRCRDIAIRYFTHSPILLLKELSSESVIYGIFRKKMPGFDIVFHSYESRRGVSLNSPPISGPVPLYLRFDCVDITVSDIFKNKQRVITASDISAKYQHKLLAVLKRLESAFVDCDLYVSSRRGDPFNTRYSYLYFLKSHLLPLFPKCRMYRICGDNLRTMSANEVEQEPLLLLPQLYNTDGTILLGFDFTSSIRDVNVYYDDVSEMISVREVISWLHRPNPGNTSKSRKLILGNECLARDCVEEEEILMEIKTRLLEIFSTATIRCPYTLEIDFDRYNTNSEIFKDVFIAANDNTGEELKIYYREYPCEEAIFERKTVVLELTSS